MRQQSKITVNVRGRCVGGSLPLICLPLIGRDKDEILGDVKTLIALSPDLIEWRVDCFSGAVRSKETLLLLSQLRELLGEIPLVFTCRIEREGGNQELTQEYRLQLITEAITSGGVDFVDIELCNGDDFILAVRQCAEEKDVKLIFSHHNFDETPDEDFMSKKLLEAAKKGADIAKLSVMPNSYRDVLKLLSVTEKARTELLDIPIITISMGREGEVSRLAGGLFGSDITFASGTGASAPGQIPIKKLKEAMALFY
jgi:3-dehydroquinate dehydratase-1